MLGLLILLEVRIAVVGRGNKSLLDHARGDPTDEVQDAACLVVGAGSAGSAERLATHNCSGRLVIDIEVSGSCAKLVGDSLKLETVLSEDGSGESVRRSGVAEIGCIVHLDRKSVV